MTTNTIEEIKKNYLQMEKALVSELFMTVNGHHPTAGAFREKVWKSFFESIIPKKFTIQQGAFLIDSKGHVSRETDLVIFDEQYTPYVFKNRNIQFIPIEAVVAVIQCKSTKLESRKLIEWEKSIEDLKPDGGGYAASADPRNPIILNGERTIRPLKLICGLFDCTKNGVKTFLNKKSKSDLIITAYSKDKGIKIYNKQHQTIGFVFKRITGRELSECKPELQKILDISTEHFAIRTKQQRGKEINLLTLVFQLNQYLMLINNPMFFPHRAYIKMFNESEYNITDGEK